MSGIEFYFKLGLNHILSWSSIDHILFLIALIVVFSLKDWRKLLYLVTLFTLAHSFSLLLSVYGVLSINESLIETLILWTILITATSNIIIKNQKLITQLHYYFSFIFGLIHGLGFARDFKMLIAGQIQKFIPLITFALGIETAQILLGIFILLLLGIIQNFWQKNTRELYVLVSGIIVGYVLALL